MTFIERLKEENNKTTTTNGGIAYKSTHKTILDLSTKIGNSRFMDDREFANMIIDAYNEDKVLATKLFAYARDVRQGGGDKKFGSLGFFLVLENISEDKLPLFINIVSEFGYYKDLIKIIANTDVHEKSLCLLLNKRLQEDDESETPSLLAKYMPTETTKDPMMKQAYRKFMTHVNITPKEYRKRNTRIRKKLDIIETKLTEKRYEDIDYSKVPSQAGLKYRDAFYRNDNERYLDYLDKVDNNKEKVNTTTLAPYQIVSKVLDNYRSIDKSLETLWNNLSRPDSKGLNILPVVDVSGSMYGLPIEVAISLGIIMAESNTGQFKNHFVTFSEQPEIVELKGNTLHEKVHNLEGSRWGYNTNLESVFRQILDTGINNNLPQEELPDMLFIMSDMQYDNAVTNGDSLYEHMRKEYDKHGYQLPTVVFWNIGYGNTQPVVESTKNTLLVSGFSQNIFNTVFNLDLDDLENYTPWKALVETLENPRYKVIEDLY